MDRVTIVDKDDNVIGSEERKVVYEKGLIHRLIRVLLVNKKGEVLLQWRSAHEDTFPETWDQSAGGHVDEGEDYETAAYRELEEELGIKNADLSLIDTFYTSGEFGDKKINRFNAIYFGRYNGETITLQEEEVEKIGWFKTKDLYEKLETTPEDFTHGLKTLMADYNEQIKNFIDPV